MKKITKIIGTWCVAFGLLGVMGACSLQSEAQAESPTTATHVQYVQRYHYASEFYTSRGDFCVTMNTTSGNYRPGSITCDFSGSKK